MISMFGRGFDSRQLHVKATNKHPRKGVFALSEPMKTCFQKVSEKAKEPCTAGWLFVIFRTEAKGSMSEANYPPLGLRLRLRLRLRETWWLFSICRTGT